MARKKTLSDDIYNARRRAKRAIAKYRKSAKSMTGRQRQVALKRARDLEKIVKQSYNKPPRKNAKKETPEAREKRINQAYKQMVDATRQTAGGKKRKGIQQDARNRSFALNLANALNYDNIDQTGAYSAIAKDPEMARAMALVFMHAHTDIRREQYDQHTPQNIYKAIMAAHGTDDLQTAFLETMRENKEAIQNMYRALKDDEADDGDAKYSSIRPYLSMVHQQARYMA